MTEGGVSNIFTPENEHRIVGKIRRHKKILVALFLLIVLGIAGVIVFLRMRIPVENDVISATNVVEKTPTSALVQNDIAVPSESVPLFGSANYASENFRVGDVAIGGEAEFLLTEDSPEPIAIDSIRGESFVEKNKQEVKLVLSWRTNKLARSTVEYSKGAGQAKKSVSEDDYGLNHSMVIGGLDQASTYVYAVSATDRFGNSIMSESHAVYTGSKTVSLFDLIAGAIGDVFGWAVKKN